MSLSKIGRSSMSRYRVGSSCAVVYVRVYVRCFFFLFLGNEEIDEVSIDDLYVLHGGMHWAGKSPDLRVKSTTTDDDGLANNEKN